MSNRTASPPGDESAPINVEVAYARPEQQIILNVRLPAGSSVEEAIRASGVLERFPEIDLAEQKVGIFSKVVPLTQTLAERDRIEIYRALIADPKAARRNRAQKQAQSSGRTAEDSDKAAQAGKSD